MQKISKTVALTALILIVLSVGSYASFPQPRGFVNDFAGVIDRESASRIMELANSLKEQQGVELAVVTIRTAEPTTVKDYATSLFNEWGIGGPEDSGLLMLLAIEEREIQVEVGYGLEGVLPDGKVGGILDKAVIPHFAKGEYGKGFLEGAKAFQGELSGESYAKKESDGEFMASLIIFLIIAVVVYLSARKGPQVPKGPRGTVFRSGPVYPGTIRPPRSSGGPRGGGGGFGGGRSGGGGAGRKF
ncbi:MAG: TPM domain-containing protein [Firmicutes bacterium]|nr:TPM domain-containing protein [Bacillota bacterium]